mmetsp:Transcript_26459/g.42516  ORF Transcript_26459/g.42516 Transcript_26459/m.42516 type:complete len:169 (+) Transcript_26459:146-652(+)
MWRCWGRSLRYRSGATLVSALIVLQILLTSQFGFNDSEEAIEMKSRRGKKNPTSNRRQAKYSAAGVKRRIKVKRKPFKKDSRQEGRAKPRGNSTKTVPIEDLLLGGQLKGHGAEISDHDSEDSFYRDVRRSLERKKRNQLRIHVAAGPEVLKSLTKDYMSKEQQENWR